MSCSTGGTSNGSLICSVSVGMTGATARIGSVLLRVMAFFISNCCNCRLVCETIRFCLAVATELLRLHHRDGRQRADLHLLLGIGERLVRQLQRALLHLHVLVGIHQVPVDVLDLRNRLMIWFWKAASMMARLLRAMRIQRRFELKPNPCNRCCRNWKRKLALSAGIHRVERRIGCDATVVDSRPTSACRSGSPGCRAKLAVVVALIQRRGAGENDGGLRRRSRVRSSSRYPSGPDRSCRWARLRPGSRPRYPPRLRLLRLRRSMVPPAPPPVDLWPRASSAGCCRAGVRPEFPVPVRYSRRVRPRRSWCAECPRRR